MNIEQAQTSQIKELAAFARSTYATAFGEEIGDDKLQKHLIDSMSDQRFKQMMTADTFYLARSGAALVGFAQTGDVDRAYGKYLSEFDHHGAELRRLYVLPDQQSKGIGSALIERVLQDSAVTTTCSLYLTTWESNCGAQKLYRKHNFKNVGKIPEYGGDGKLNGHEHIMLRINSRPAT